MKILFLNQSFHPDVVSSAQHLADAALALVERGHQVTVLCSRRACDDPATRFKRQECWHGVHVIRVGSTGFGKDSKWGRILDIMTLLASASLQAFTLPRVDLVVALTSPPLIGLAGLCVARLHGVRFVHWILDLNPDEAIAAGWLRAGSPVALLLERAARCTLRRADRVIVLDRFMRERILAKSVRPEGLSIIPPWAHHPVVGFDPVGRRRFRREHGLEGNFVIMYSGNHSACHPLETVLRAARVLAGTLDIAFCFVGGGTEFRKILRLQANLSAGLARDSSANAPNIVCLPYQPLRQLSASLSAADLHLVVMGDAFVGVVHPCKIYNILTIGSPIIYIGPVPSPTSETLAGAGSLVPWGVVQHGDVDALLAQIRRIRRLSSHRRVSPPVSQVVPFSPRVLIPQFISQLESLSERPMKTQLTYIAPGRAGLVLGALYGAISLIIAPIFLIVAALTGKSGAVFALFLPVLYFVGGFLGGIIVAGLYNWTTRWTGGFQIELANLETSK